MSRLVFSAGKPTVNWESMLQDILEKGMFSSVGTANTTLSFDYNDLHLVLTGTNLQASSGREMISGEITGFTITAATKSVLTMSGLTSLDATDFQLIITSASGLVPGTEAKRTVIAPMFTREAVNATGSSTGDTILGSDHIDRLNGAGGNDNIIGGAGVDILTGGTGVDLLDYRFDTRSVGIKADLATNTVVDNNSGALRVDTISGFENLAGSILDDIIRGTSGDNKLLGDGGNDWIYGLAGNDGLFGGTGNDFLSGGTGNNYYNGGSGTDRFVGGSVSGPGMWDKVSYEFETGLQGIVATFTGAQSISVVDTFGTTDTGTFIEEIKGSKLADTFNGSAGGETAEGMGGDDAFKMAGGIDTVVYQHEFDAGTRKGVIVNLSNTGISADIGSGLVNVLARTSLDSFGSTDTFSSVENIMGTRYADHIVGNGQANLLSGSAGNDVLSGLGGSDTLVGGLGRDLMTGGYGIDIFRFNTANDSGSAANSRDVISDFTHLVDEFDLKNIDASSKAAGNNAFKWIGSSGFHGIAGELHFRFVGTSTTLIEGDRNGDARADFVIELANRTSISLADVIL
jgi:Ca2+-binding RTX toxin-like protein